MIHTILVPYDGSELAARAIPVAAGLAKRHGARIEFVTVSEPRLPMPAGEGALVFDRRLDDDIAAALQEDLDALGSRFAADHPGIDVSTRLRRGRAAPEIAAHAEETGADLVVLTTHGRGGLSRLWLGSVTEGLLRRLRIPVLVLPAESEPQAVAGDFPHVLVPLDGSPVCERILETLRRIATGRVHYTLIHVAPPLHPLLKAMSTEEEYQRDLDEQRRLAEYYLMQAVRRHLGDDCECKGMLRMDIQPSRAIVGASEEVGADLIALVTRGSGPVGRFFLGSVADKVLRSASVPVLLQHVDADE
jgi:nucleotide-binding universal stress UspA family protein